MEDKFIKVNGYIIQKRQIAWVNVDGNKVTIKINNGDSITTITETEEYARKLYEDIWRILS